MCRDTGYYEPRDDVAVKVVEEMVEKKKSFADGLLFKDGLSRRPTYLYERFVLGITKISLMMLT